MGIKTKIKESVAILMSLGDRPLWLAEVGVVALVMIVVITSYYEDFVPKSVLGATIKNESSEMLIHPDKRIAAEIARLESLLVRYPTYPPLLSQLVKLNKEVGSVEMVAKYEKELMRLNVAPQRQVRE